MKSFFSPSKINLFLEVLSKRSDGYHELNSLMCFSNIGDQIQIQKSKKFKIFFEGQFSDLLKNDASNNLVKKVFELMKKKFNLNSEAEIILHKNLPISSGIGGGSSNAATVIKALKEIFSLDFNTFELDKFLLSIGSDVPFCYHGSTALVRGKGEIQYKLNNVPKLYVLLVNPLFEISTKQIFSKIEIFSQKKTEIKKLSLDESTFIEILKNSNNDCQIIAENICPDIKLILNYFNNETNSLLSRMSGSGATCFGLFNNKAELNSAFSLYINKKKKWWIKKGNILNNI